MRLDLYGGDPLASDARVAFHRALADERRLAIVDALRLADRSPKELGELTGLPTNLLAFHLDVLENAGLVGRTTSEGDARRRYVVLARDRMAAAYEPPPLDIDTDRVLFVCTANSARSQLAAHLWSARTGLPALSAGTEPAQSVHPSALDVAHRHGLDMTTARPVDLQQVSGDPDLVITVCDRAREREVEFAVPVLHWSVPDPVGGDVEAFTRAFEDLSARIDHLVLARNHARSRPVDRDVHTELLERSRTAPDQAGNR